MKVNNYITFLLCNFTAPCAFCDINANCIIADSGEFECECRSGFIGDGTLCEPEGSQNLPFPRLFIF